MTTAMQSREEKPPAELAPEQEALVSALVQVFDRLIPKPAPVELPKPDPQLITLERASELTGVSPRRLQRAGRAKRFFYFVDGVPKVKLLDMLAFDPEWVLRLHPAKRAKAKK